MSGFSSETTHRNKNKDTPQGRTLRTPKSRNNFSGLKRLATSSAHQQLRPKFPDWFQKKKEGLGGNRRVQRKVNDPSRWRILLH